MHLLRTNILLRTILICLLLLVLNGCWDRVEINDLAIVMGIGLDKTEEGDIELSVQIANPKAMAGSGSSGGQSSGNPIVVETVTGRTIFDARSKLQESLSRQLFEGHNRVIFISKALAEEGIQKHIDFFARFPSPRLRANIFIVDSKVIDILKVPSDFELNSSEVARELAKLKIGMNITTKDLLEQLANESSSIALPSITVEDKPVGTKGLRVNGSAIIKENKMVGEIDNALSRGVLWLRDEIKLSSVTLEPENTEGYISFKLLRSSTDLSPTIKNGKWKMVVNITTEDDVVENETNLDVLDPKITDKLEKQLEQKVTERIQKTLDYVQKEIGADVFGFGEAFYRKFPKQWNKEKDMWAEKFPELEVEINCKAYIRRPGRSNIPQGTQKEEGVKK
ncbi:Spore germination protein A3 precursor [Paraliobacillus sp. PM-2]|uniref:Ger(x)C family spore germination protein n=1 Tax=Paraliobacillus sp. PM-2 TaxID=1462524 RepID=UPI00061C6B64|nr:Ger(x)C family spore germination protein [Paraliobacillus sp. PM-2]CQR48304.1 Spore germination protein A3 precursor [Paraliobacillus sp. PM-2]